jgi:hypothetical protein
MGSTAAIRYNRMHSRSPTHAFKSPTGSLCHVRVENVVKSDGACCKECKVAAWLSSEYVRVIPCTMVDAIACPSAVVYVKCLSRQLPCAAPQAVTLHDHVLLSQRQLVYSCLSHDCLCKERVNQKEWSTPWRRPLSQVCSSMGPGLTLQKLTLAAGMLRSRTGKCTLARVAQRPAPLGPVAGAYGPELHLRVAGLAGTGK